MHSVPKLFISYAHEPAIFEIRDYIEKVFSENNQDRFKVLVDKGLYAGEDFNKFMQSIDHCFAVILLLTPEYRSRASNRKGGVYEEYKKILANQKNRKDDFHLIPLLISGTIQDSVPPEIDSQKCIILTKLHFDKGEPIKNEHFETAIKQLLKEIKHIEEIAPFGSEDYQREKERVLKELFEEPRASFNNPKNQKLIDQIIVKNNGLKKVSNSDYLIIKGRKGSGKSTLTQVIPFKYPEKFLIDIPVNANMLDLDNVYARILKESAISIAEENKLKRREIFKLGWKYFIHLMFIDALILLSKRSDIFYLDENEKSSLIDFYYTIHKEYNSSLQFEGRNKTDRYKHMCKILFPHAIQKVVDFIEKVKIDVKNETPQGIPDWNTFFTEANFSTFCFPEKIRHITNGCIKKIKYSNKKILFTLDDFDNGFYEEKKTIINTSGVDQSLIDEDLRKRASHDTDLLYSLIQIVFESNKGELSLDSVFTVFNFCITIPEDLFLHIERLTRDSHVFINKVQTLNWTGVELMILLRKRLEKYLNKKIDKHNPDQTIKTQQQRLEEILETEFSGLPKLVEAKFNGSIVKVPLFIYILRHTFWRPREIIIYFADIISKLNTYQQRGQEITNNDIRLIVKKDASHIIEYEFISEFDSHCVNIKEIINCFKYKDQILAFSDLVSIIGHVHFRFTSHSKKNENGNELVEKLSFLYQIGFLGIILSDQKAEDESLHRYAFIFNAGQNFLKNKLQDEEDFRHHTFIIHPIFFEYLSLEKKNNKEFVLNFDYAYLHVQDRLFTLLYG